LNSVEWNWKNPFEIWRVRS